VNKKTAEYMRGYAHGYEDAVAGIEQVADEMIAAKSSASKLGIIKEENFSYTETTDARGRITREREDRGDWR